MARATTYSGKVVRIVHIFSEAAPDEYAAHWGERIIKNQEEIKYGFVKQNYNRSKNT